MTDRVYLTGFGVAVGVAALFLVVIFAPVVWFHWNEPKPSITLSRPDLIRVTCEARVFVRNPDGTTARIKITGCP